MNTINILGTVYDTKGYTQGNGAVYHPNGIVATITMAQGGATRL